MSQAQEAKLMKELQELQMREALKLYNNLSEMCFNKCVNSFLRKDLADEEQSCMNTCTAKFMKASTRSGMRFAEANYQQQLEMQQKK